MPHVIVSCGLVVLPYVEGGETLSNPLREERKKGVVTEQRKGKMDKGREKRQEGEETGRGQ